MAARLFNFTVSVSEKTWALSGPFWGFQLGGARRWKWKKAGRLGNEHGTPSGLCDRWQARLGGTGGWRSARRRLTVACCFSARSFASSSCFCKAAWRDFISSLSSESRERQSVSTSSSALRNIMAFLNTRALMHTNQFVLTKFHCVAKCFMAQGLWD